jgi:threonine dehydrogenase-like Zn-dependent dehydrogenase
VLVGTGHDYPRLNHNRVIVLENTILGSYNYDADGFAAALALLASGAMPLDALVEPVDVFLDELLPVMQRCAAGELPGKVMVRPRRSGES